MSTKKYFWNIIEWKVSADVFDVQFNERDSSSESGYTYGMHILTEEKVTKDMLIDLSEIFNDCGSVKFVTRYLSKDKHNPYKEMEVYSGSDLTCDFAGWENRYVVGKEAKFISEFGMKNPEVFIKAKVKTVRGKKVIKLS